MNWTSAEKFCQNKSSHLASVTSRNTSDYISKKFSRRRWHVWIGGTDQDKEGLWKWTDLSPWNFADWEDGSPPDHNEEHNCLLQSRWGWNDVPCEVTGWFLCSKQKETGENKKIASFDHYNCKQARPQRSIETIASFDQWSGTIENH